MKIILYLLLLSSLLWAQKSVKLQLSWKHQFQFAGYYVAKEKGFYKEAGIDLDIMEYSGDINPYDSIQQGRTDFAVGRSSLLMKVAQGERLVALGAIFQYSPMMLLVTKTEQIKNLADLKKRKIMITYDAESSADILAMIFSQGLNRKDVTIQKHSFKLQDLVEGTTDAMASYISNEPLRLKDQGINYRIFHPKDYGFEFYNDILFGSENFVTNHPKLTKAFYEASIRGWKYAFEHIEETALLIHEKYNSQKRSIKALINEGKVLKPLAYYNGEEKLGHLDKKQLEKIVDTYKVMGLITKTPDLERFIFEGNHPKVINLHLTKQEIIYLSFAMVIFVIVLFVTLLFFSIRRRWLITKDSLLHIIKEQTEKLHTQNRMILTQSRLAAIGEMLSNIAHQWRQPLTSITATTATVRLPLQLGKPVSNDFLEAKLKSIETNCLYLSETISDFTNYFRSEDHEIEPFDVQDAVKQVEDLTREMCQFNEISLVTQLQSTILTNNKKLLVQAFINLVNNAKDAFEDHQVDPHQRFLFITMERSDNDVTIIFKDSAGGIDDSILISVFEPYSTTKHASQGTGLGLYMSYEIVTKQFLGSIRVDNLSYKYEGKPLRGAAFIITLPL